MRTKRHFVGWKYDTGSPGMRYHEADTLAAAIRDAGVRCETCEHWSPTMIHDPKQERFCLYADSTTGKHHFCADHSLLTQPSEGK